MTSYAWNVNGRGDWNSASNWTPAGGPPTATDSATINDSTTTTVDVDTADVANSLTLSDANATLVDNGGIASLTIGGTLTMSNGTLYISAPVPGRGSLTVGALNLSGGALTVYQGGQLNLNGTLSQTGGTLTLDGGTISGGTIDSTAGTQVFDDAGSTIGQSGTLSGVTFDGPLNLTANYASVQLANGTTVVSSSGSGPGTINVTGTGSSLIFDNAQTVSNETINLGNSSYYDSLYEYDTTGAGQVLTLASSVTINVAGLAIFYTGGSSGDGIVNKGLIDATTSAGLLQIESSGFTNSGTIDVSGGAMAAIDSTTFTTTASSLIEIGANSYLNIDPTNVWSNLGLITLASGASLLLQGSESTTGLGSISNSGGTVELSGGTLNNAGQTLNGSSLGLTLVGGTITGGTVSGLAFTSYGGTLSGVTLEGPLNLENFVAQGGKPSAVGSLTGTNTLSNATISGSGELDNDGTTTVSGLTIGGVTTFYDGGTMTENGGSVTLGDAVGNTADLNIASTGTWDIQDDSSIYRGTATGSTITNSGLLEKTSGTGTSVISPDVANNGTIFVSCGTPAQAGALDFVGAVTGAGTDTISSHSMLEFNTTVASTQTVSFNGVNGALYLTNPTSFAGLISGFTGSNCIQLPAGWSFSNFSENLSGTLGTLTVSNGSTTAALDFAGDFTAGNFAVEQLEGITYILPATPAAPHVNFNGNSLSDILWQNANGQASIWEMNGNSLIGGGAVTPNPGPTWKEIGTGDFNADGHSDILFQNTCSGQASIWEMNGNTLIGGGPVSPNPGPSWHAIGTGDFNDDGHADILFQNTSSGQVSIWEMDGNTLIGGGPVNPNPGPSWKAIGTGDFNDDGHSDILFQNANSGQVSIWEMNGNTLIGGGPIHPNPGPAWKVIGTGDFNADGHSDILFQNTSSGQVSIWEMNGNTLIGGGPVTPNPGPSWHAVETGDFNGDGHSDILFQNTSSGQASIWEMDGTHMIGGGPISPNPGPSWHAIKA